MPSKVSMERISRSPVTIALAHAPTAQASTWMSSGSRNAEGKGMAGPSTISAAARKREIISRALWPLCSNLVRNFSRWITSSNSAMARAEAQRVAEPSSSASTNREGFPLQSEPDTSTFISTTSFTRAPLRPGGPYFSANLVHSQWFARHGTNLLQHLPQFLPGAPAAHFVGQQFRHPTVVQQAHLARLPDDPFGQIQFNGHTHDALFFHQETYTNRGPWPRTDSDGKGPQIVDRSWIPVAVFGAKRSQSWQSPGSRKPS